MFGACIQVSGYLYLHAQTLHPQQGIWNLPLPLPYHSETRSHTKLDILPLNQASLPVSSWDLLGMYPTRNPMLGLQIHTTMFGFFMWMLGI